MAKTKALISFAVTAKLICVFVFAYAKIRFSHVAAHIIVLCSTVLNVDYKLLIRLSYTHFIIELSVVGVVKCMLKLRG